MTFCNIFPNKIEIKLPTYFGVYAKNEVYNSKTLSFVYDIVVGACVVQCKSRLYPIQLVVALQMRMTKGRAVLDRCEIAGSNKQLRRKLGPV